MLRVEVHDSANSLSLKLDGRFTGDDAENTRTLIARCREGMRLIIDLTDVTFIDSVGEESTIVFWPVRGGVRCFEHPIRSTYVSACICALLEMGHRSLSRFPQNSDAGPLDVSWKTRKSENLRQARCDFPRFRAEFSRHPSRCFPPHSSSSASSSLRKSWDD